MKEFPYSASEWEPVKEAADGFLAAVQAEDQLLAESLLADLKRCLAVLREQHGEHPILLETEADFCFDHQEATGLYERAIEIAQSNGLTTRSIMLSYAQTLIENDGDLSRAESMLRECEPSVRAEAEESELADLEDLLSLLRSKLEA